MDNGKFLAVDLAYGKASVTESDVMAVRQAYRESGIFEIARKSVADFTQTALSSLKPIRESTGKDALMELAETLVKRKF